MTHCLLSLCLFLPVRCCDTWISPLGTDKDLSFLTTESKYWSNVRISDFLSSLYNIYIQTHTHTPIIILSNNVKYPGGGFYTLRDSEAFRSSLMTADRASGLMPCSHSLTHMERDSMSKPVFSNLEISSSTVDGRRW